MKKKFLTIFFIVFFIALSIVFGPTIYIRFEVQQYLYRLSKEVDVRTQQELEAKVKNFLVNLGQSIEFKNLTIKRELPYPQIILRYKTPVNLNFGSRKIHLIELYQDVKT